MAISFVGSDQAAADSITIPTHQAGDLIIICAQGASAAAPSGWAQCSASGTTSKIGWKIAASGSETSGTWTGADNMFVAVYRGAVAVGTAASATASGTTLTYTGFTLGVTTGTSWLVGIAVNGSSATLDGEIPTGWTQREHYNTGSRGGVVSDTNGAVSSWAGENVTVASQTWRCTVLELIAGDAAPNGITLVGTATGTTSATIPTHQAGDIIIAFAFRDGSATVPTIPTGWVGLIREQVSTTAACVAAVKVAASASETSGTWTNATSLIVAVFRASSGAICIGGVVETEGTSNSINNGTVTMNNTDGTSEIVTFVGSTVDINIESDFSFPGSTLSTSVSDAVDEAAMFLSCGLNNFIANGGVTKSSGSWMAVSVELVWNEYSGPRIEEYVVSEKTDASATTFNISLPATLTPGHLLLAIASHGDASDVTAPSGWTEIGGATLTSRIGVFAKVCVGDEGSTAAIGGGSSEWEGICFRISNWGGTIADDIEFAGSMTIASATTFDIPALDPSWIDDTLHIVGAFYDVTTTGGIWDTAPAGVLPIVRQINDVNTVGESNVFGARGKGPSNFDPGNFTNTVGNTKGARYNIGIRARSNTMPAFVLGE